VLVFEVRHAALQLDELRFAERSPRGAAVEDHQGPPATSGLMEIHQSAVLVWQPHFREALANRRADRGEVDTEICDRRHTLSSIQSRG